MASSRFDITFTSDTTGNPPTTRNIVITFNASGSINGTIRANTNVFSTVVARIIGTAAITYSTVGSTETLRGGFDFGKANSNGAIPYEVNGFKQSEATQ